MTTLCEKIQKNWILPARDLTGWEIMERIEKGHDIAIIPFGTMEMHGPQLGIGCDTYIAEAVAYMLGAKIKGTVFDTVSYAWVGCTKYTQPTVGLSIDMEKAYARRIADELLRCGFKRIYFIQFHGPGHALRSMALEFFEDTGIPLAFYGLLHRSDFGKKECPERGIAWEASLMAGAAKFFGRKPAIKPEAMPPEPMVLPPAFHARNRVMATGADIGSLGTSDLHHGCFDGKVDPDTGIELMDKLTDTMAKSADDLKEYGDAWGSMDLNSSCISDITKKYRNKK